MEGRKRRCPGFQQEPLVFRGKTPGFAVHRPLNCAGPSPPMVPDPSSCVLGSCWVFWGQEGHSRTAATRRTQFLWATGADSSVPCVLLSE